MSIQRTCQACGRRLHGTTPGAITILVDGQPLDAAIVLCGTDAVNVRRVLDKLRGQGRVADQARHVHIDAPTQQLRPVPDAVTEQFRTLPRDAIAAFNRETHGTWPPQRAPVDAQVAVPLNREAANTVTKSFGRSWRRKPS